LLKDLQPLVSLSTTMTANEAGNSLIITDSRANINRVAQIIKAIDMGAETVTKCAIFSWNLRIPRKWRPSLTRSSPMTARRAGRDKIAGGSVGPGAVRAARFQEFFRGAAAETAGGRTSASGAAPK
jgi:hypothetical protein